MAKYLFLFTLTIHQNLSKVKTFVRLVVIILPSLAWVVPSSIVHRLQSRPYAKHIRKLFYQKLRHSIRFFVYCYSLVTIRHFDAPYCNTVSCFIWLTHRQTWLTMCRHYVLNSKSFSNYCSLSEVFCLQVLVSVIADQSWICKCQRVKLAPCY